MPPLPPTGGRDTLEIKEFRCHRLACNVYINRAVCDGSTDAPGRHWGRSPVDNNDDDNGGNNDDGGDTAKMPYGVGDEF
jgi:hypothetical protein